MGQPLPIELHGATLEARFEWLIQQFKVAEQADYIGEDVSQLHHALQCATLAHQHGDDDMTLASLLHDIGHIVPSDQPSMDQLGTQNHEQIGADVLLALGFSHRVARLVGGHVDAKRYLSSIKPGYLNKLSPASRRTLDFQGGPMSAEERAAFERHPDHKALIQLRGFDEGAKCVGVNVRALNNFLPLIKQHLQQQDAAMVVQPLEQPLTKKQLIEWRSNQVLVLPRVLQGAKLEALQAWTRDLAQRPESAGRWMKYFERTERDDKLLCRIENFIPYHAGMDTLLRGPEMLARVSQLMNEDAVLFKEKINFKLPGGSGFSAHQDAPAFDAFGQKYHITVLITVDPSDTSNGGLEFGDTTDGHQILKQNPDGTVADEISNTMKWKPLDLPAGSVVFFDSYIPHRSHRNESDRPRRSLYITYSRASEGDWREDYYADKRKTFPPEIEREPGIDYTKRAGRYNLANPIR